jgi:Trp operon repressor
MIEPWQLTLALTAITYHQPQIKQIMLVRPRKQKRSEVNARILKIHEAIVQKVVNQPELLGQVHQTLEQRYKNKLMRYGSCMLWQSILETFDNPELFKSLLLSDDERTANLRRETIFTGVLSEDERQQILSGLKG